MSIRGCQDFGVTFIWDPVLRWLLLTSLVAEQSFALRTYVGFYRPKIYLGLIQTLENWTFFLYKERNVNFNGLETHFSEARLCYEQKKKN